MPKRKCNFTDALKKEFPFLRAEEDKLLCTLCKGVFSIEHGGRSDITQHVQKKKHRVAEAARSSSKKLTAFMTTQGKLDEEGKRLAAEEGLFTFHTIKHNHSYRSMDCTSTLVRSLFEKKFSCGRTKCEAIVVNVLAPFALREITKDLQEAKYVSVMVDTSNHNNLKLVPVLVRYFIPNKGIEIKLLEFQNLSGETAEMLTNHILCILKKYKLTDKVIAFCGDNCNTNFGGVRRKGSNNVFSKLRQEVNDNILGIGCAAHIVHNAMQTSADILPIDADTIINKVFQYFHIYAVRVSELKSFCEFVDVEYRQVLGSVKTRWLSLQPAVNRVIEMYEGLKSYFLSQEKCPKLLMDFFSNPQSQFWLHFINSQLKVCANTVKKIEKDNICGNEVADELCTLKNKLMCRKTQNFRTSVMISLLKDLEDGGLMKDREFTEIANRFYETFLQYVENWAQPFEKLNELQWVQLNSPPSWNQVQKCLQWIIEIDNRLEKVIDEDKLFDEVRHVQNIFEIKSETWKNSGSATENKWMDIFSVMKDQNIEFESIVCLVSFALAIPGTNAALERVFSIVNCMWTDEKNRFNVETVKAMVTVNMHFRGISCISFYNFLLEQPKLLQEIQNSQKYQRNTGSDSGCTVSDAVNYK